jgi:type I restriction enzyme S subunit
MPDRAAPPGWKWVALSDVAEMASGHTPSRNHPEYWSNAQISWVTATDANPADGGVINDTREKINQLGLENSAAVLLPAGTVCLSRTGASIGYTVILGHPMATNQGFVNWICSDALNKWFLLHLFMAERRALFSFGEGSAHKTIYFPEAKAFHICLPPRREQDQIVTKLAELFSDLDAGVAALERVRANLKRHRAAVLKAAVEGRLTEEWRTRHPATEPAAKLLERILAERRAKWEQDQLRKFKEAGKTPPKGWKEKYDEPTPPATENLPALPHDWRWSTVDQLISYLRNGWSLKPNPEPPGHRLLRISAVRSRSVDLSEVRFVPQKRDEVADYFIEDGDLLFTRYNGSVDLLGVCGLVRGCSEPTLHPDKLIRVKAVLGQPLNAFLEIASNVGESRRHMKSRARTTAGQTGISGPDVREMPIPLPPLAEQAEIVAEVDRRLSVADAAETQVEHALQRAVRLRQAILKRAFEGKLVPQDPADEPAATLLERAKAQTNGHRASPRNTPKRRSSACA